MQELLPVELLTHIFKHLLESSELAALYACTRVNSLFRALAQPQLYSNITLLVTDNEFAFQDNGPIWALTTSFSSPSAGMTRHPSRVRKLLTDQPHIAGYVRTLKVLVQAQKQTARRSPRDLHFSSWPELVQVGDADTVAVVALLTSLERVVLHHGGFTNEEWDRFDGTFQDAIIQALELPSMREVILERIKFFPLYHLNRLTALERVTLSGAEMYDSAPPYVSYASSNPSRPRTRLTQLTLQDCRLSLPHIIGWLYSQDGPDLSRLTHLKANVSIVDDLRSLPFVFSACARSLRVLDLEPGLKLNMVCSTLQEGGAILARSIPGSYRSLLSDPNLPQHLFTGWPMSITTTRTPLHLPPFVSVHNQGSDSALSSVSLSTPFSLSRLSALKHLQLTVVVEHLLVCGVSADDRHEVYSTPFEFIQRVLAEFGSGSEPQGTIPSPLRAAHQASVSLERLTLEMSFNVPIIIDRKDFLRGLSFSPLACALSSFSVAMPSLECAEIRARCWQIPGMRLVRALEEDVHLAPLVEQGLLRVLEG